MRILDILEAFETEIGVINDALIKPNTLDSQYFLNAGLDKFWKTRYSGFNIKRTGFELDQKRIDDLRTLVTTREYTEGGPKEFNIKTDRYDPEAYRVFLPDNYLIRLGDTVGILPTEENDCWPMHDLYEEDENENLIKIGEEYDTKYVDTLDGTIDTIDEMRRNSLSEHRLHYCYARPIRLQQNNVIRLFTDGNYKVSSYKLRYLRMPEKIDLFTDPQSEYTDMPEHTIIEIVKTAAQLYIENKANPRYETYINEVNTME